MNDEHQHNEDFLKDLVDKKQPFKTPDNYFNQLSEKISIDLFEEKLSNNHGFKTPDNYFDNFSIKKPKNKIRYLLPYISSAAIIVFGLFLFNSNETEIDQLSNEEIISYLSFDDNINTNDIIENAIINTNDIMFANIDRVDLNMEQLDIELSEYDIIEF